MGTCKTNSGHRNKKGRWSKDSSHSMKTKLKKGKITLTCEVSMSNMQVRPCE
jgi:hypothetical protein